MISKFNSLSLRAQAIVITAGILLSAVVFGLVVSFVPANVIFTAFLISVFGGAIYFMYRCVLNELKERERNKNRPTVL